VNSRLIEKKLSPSLGAARRTCTHCIPRLTSRRRPKEEEGPGIADADPKVAYQYKHCASAIVERHSEDPSSGPVSKGLKHTDAPQNFETFRLRQLACPVIVEQHRIRAELLPQKNCAYLAQSQTMFSLGRRQSGWVLNGLHLNPFRFRNLPGPGQTSASDDNFVTNLRRDVDTWKESMQEFETAKLSQNNKRG